MAVTATSTVATAPAVVFAEVAAPKSIRALAAAPQGHRALESHKTAGAAVRVS